MSPEPQLRRLAQVAVNVQDVERATAFYRDALGLRHLFSAGALAFFDIGGTRLMLSRAERPEFDHPASILYYDVADIGEAHRTLAGHGVRFEIAASSCWRRSCGGRSGGAAILPVTTRFSTFSS